MRASDFWRVAASLPFIEGAEVEREPLVEEGRIDHLGRWDGENTRVRRALVDQLPDANQLEDPGPEVYWRGQEKLRAQFATRSGDVRTFLSYARKDNEFADWLCSGLKAENIAAYRDTTDTLPGEEWWRRLQDLIGAADSVVFVVSPHSVGSKVCEDEVAYAQSQHKRIFPVILGAVDWTKVPGALARAHAVSFVESRERAASLRMLVESLKTDADWIREHTRLVERAHHWVAMGRAEPELLLGRTLAEAERWLAMRPNTEASLPELVVEYINASRGAERARRDAQMTSVNREASLNWALGALAQERLAQLMMAIGEREVGLNTYRASLRDAVEHLRRMEQDPHGRDAEKAQHAMSVVIFEWVLASHGDAPLARLGRIVTLLRDLRRAGKLNAEQVKLIARAEGKSAELRRHGVTE